MPFSLGSYLLGVGTMLGALALGFGGGVLLTHTAMKEGSAGQTRVERLARAEPASPAPRATAAQVTPAPNQAVVAPNQVSTPDPDHPASVGGIKQDAAPAELPAAVSPDPVPAAQASGTSKPDGARKPEPETPRQIQAAKEPQPVKQEAREPQPPKQAEQTERTEAKAGELRETDRSAERSRRYAERRQPDNGAPRMRQRGLMVREEPAQEVVLSRPREQHLDLFGGFFGRPADAND
jgi:hypothetical protein